MTHIHAVLRDLENLSQYCGGGGGGRGGGLTVVGSSAGEMEHHLMLLCDGNLQTGNGGETASGDLS